MIGFAIDLLLTVFFLKVIASALPDIEIDGFGPAFAIAVVMAVAGTAIGFVAAPLFVPVAGMGWWVGYAISFALSVIVLMVALNVVPGVRVQSATSVIIAALLLSALRTASGFAMRLVDFSSLAGT